MTIIVLGVVTLTAIASAVGAVVLMVKDRRTADQHLIQTLAAAENARRDAEAVWASERRELINRVQAPQFVPREPVIGFQVPEPEPDGIEEVGQVRQLDDEQMAEYLSELS